MARDLVAIARTLQRSLAGLEAAEPVRWIYHPLDYAWANHRAYLERYGAAPKRVVLMGMNPGPWGMAQTGVPFGDVEKVREWLGLTEPIGSPDTVHPKKPVLGHACHRREVSGSRLWGWARDEWGTPEAFFTRYFVANYCPALFLDAAGRNLTPDRLPRATRQVVEAACDRALLETVALLEPELVIGIGAWAEGRARQALAGSGVRIGRILHPSPASPAANRGWLDTVRRQLQDLGAPRPR